MAAGPGATPAGWPARLPVPPTPLIGREREVAAVGRPARRRGRAPAHPDRPRRGGQDPPGPAGRGRPAARRPSRTGRGFVDLAPLADPALVAPGRSPGPWACAEPPGGRPAGRRCATTCARRRLLLVLDNFEHLLAGRARWWPTARRPARGSRCWSPAGRRCACAGEQEFAGRRRWPCRRPARARRAPAPRAGRTRLAARCALFVERARAVAPGLRARRRERRRGGRDRAGGWTGCRWPSSWRPPACRAAARRRRCWPAWSAASPLLTGGAARPAGPPADAARRDRLELRPARAGERALFRAWPSSPAGCTLEAAEAVARGDRGGAGAGVLRRASPPWWSTSLVAAGAWRPARRRAAGPRASRMLETVREYALERLEASGEAAALRRRGTPATSWRWPSGRRRSWRGPEQVAWLDRLEAEHDNLRAAWRWALAGGRRGAGGRRDGARRAAPGGGPRLVLVGPGATWARAGVAERPAGCPGRDPAGAGTRAPGGATPPASRARRPSRGRGARRHGRGVRGGPWRCTASLALAGGAGRAPGLGHVAAWPGGRRLFGGGAAGAGARCGGELANSGALGDRGRGSVGPARPGAPGLRRGDRARPPGRGYGGGAGAVPDQVGSTWGWRTPCAASARWPGRRGRRGGRTRSPGEPRRSARRGGPAGLAQRCRTVAGWLTARGEPARAPPPGRGAAAVRGARWRLRATPALPAQVGRPAWRRCGRPSGARRTGGLGGGAGADDPEEAVALALEPGGRPAGTAGGAAPPAPHAGFTAREREVAALVGAGLTNRQIGARPDHHARDRGHPRRARPGQAGLRPARRSPPGRRSRASSIPAPEPTSGPDATDHALAF